MNDSDINDAMSRVIPKIKLHWDEIVNLINEIPNMYDDLEIISEVRKAFYIKGMELRLEIVFLPIYKQIAQE